MALLFWRCNASICLLVHEQACVAFTWLRTNYRPQSFHPTIVVRAPTAARVNCARLGLKGCGSVQWAHLSHHDEYARRNGARLTRVLPYARCTHFSASLAQGGLSPSCELGRRRLTREPCSMHTACMRHGSHKRYLVTRSPVAQRVSTRHLQQHGHRRCRR